MIPITFPHQNNVIGKPADMTDEECTGLPAFQYTDSDGRPNVLSCWQMSKEELAEVNRNGGKVWVNTLGRTVAPFSLDVMDPFEIVETPELP